MLKQKYDYLAPDGSEIRLLPVTSHGGCAHCLLPEGKKTKAVKHKSVEEIWYVLSGEGEIWQKSPEEEITKTLSKGICVVIPTGNHFQFRNIGKENLCILIVTMPPWPGPDEAVSVEDHW
ncbi:MAG: cupin domain-containing protein [Saprospiraceae bacterium]|uniref:Cupin domain-containing protein n=1 Tax=Candidatus Opimibacter skivensis TaxID=2982028 RepID=A0A9D7XUR0_9BACT|nr:cupin domain-containing protein [Candidatus Opimibacter skivensis]